MEENKKEVKENVIVPSYMKKEQKEDSKKKKKKSAISKKNKKRIILLVVFLLIIVVLIFSISYAYRVIKFSKYNEYGTQMEKYGLAGLYDNKKTTSHEAVTKSEAIKIAIATIINIEDIPYSIDSELKYENELWVEYAIENEVITAEDVNEKNYNKKVTYIEYIRYFQNARKVLKGETLNTSIYPDFTDMKLLSDLELYAVSDLVYNNVIENAKVKLNPSRTLYKGELNKLTCDMVNTYNLLLPEGEKFNISEDKIPENVSEYPFTLYDVAKEAYEKPFIISDEAKFIGPNKIFASERTVIEVIFNIVNNYYNNILNVDYETIDINSFYEKIRNNSLFEVDLETVKKYVDYVKANKIKIEGKAKAQLPIFYYDGTYYRMRVQISFKVVNSDTKNNLLFYDLENGETSYEYSKDEYDIYIDSILQKPLSSVKTMYIWGSDLYSEKTDEIVIGINKVEKEVVEQQIESDVQPESETNTNYVEPQEVQDEFMIEEEDMPDVEEDENIPNSVDI